MDTHLKWESLLILLLKKVRLQVQEKFTRGLIGVNTWVIGVTKSQENMTDTIVMIYSRVMIIALTFYTGGRCMHQIPNSSFYGPWCIGCNSIYCCSQVCIQYRWMNRHWPYHRTRLSSNTVEALICFQDWLREAGNMLLLVTVFFCIGLFI